MTNQAPETDNQPVAAKASSLTKPSYGPFTALVVTIGGYFLSMYVVSGIIIGIVLGAVSVAQHKSIEQLFDATLDSTFGQFALTLIAYLSMLGVVYLAMRFLRVTFKQIGLQRGPALKDIGYALITAVIYYIVLAFTMTLVGQFLPSVNLDQEQQLGFDKGAEGGLSLGLIFISLVVLPPLVEEIIMRGFLYTGLRNKFRILPAALITSFVFCLAHLQIGEGAPPLYIAAIDTFILSMFLVFLRERTGSLWAGIFTHAMKNGLAFILLFIVGTS